MGFKNFRFQCLWRLFFIFLSLTATTYFLTQTKLYATVIIFVFIIALQLYNLFLYVQKTNMELKRFLESIRHSDFSTSFTRYESDVGFGDLYDEFNLVIKQFQKARSEKEEQYRYLQTVVQHIGTGLFAFKATGEIDLINNAARRLLKIPHARHIKQLQQSCPELAEKILQLRSGQKTLVKLYIENEFLQLTVYATEFVLHQQKYKLVSLSNIQSELEEKEMEAWQNLIRVLTHEIMNSITPISSLASTTTKIVGKHLDKFDHPSDAAEDFQDVLQAIQTIEKRSDNLLHFVQNYRKLTKIPAPDFKIFQISELFAQVNQLVRAQMQQFGIQYQCSIDPESLELTADPGLLEQVLLNLLKNAVEAVQGQTAPVVELDAGLDGTGRPFIRVSDNGYGIQKDAMKNMFIPFFTTKKEGSGIGLSLSRQIMRQHGGAIQVVSVPNEKTVFTLRF